MSVFTTTEYIKSTLTYCSVLTVYPFGFSATIGEKVTTEKGTVHVHTATRWNMDLEMNVEKGEQANLGRTSPFSLLPFEMRQLRLAVKSL